MLISVNMWVRSLMLPSIPCKKGLNSSSSRSSSNIIAYRLLSASTVCQSAAAGQYMPEVNAPARQLFLATAFDPSCLRQKQSHLSGQSSCACTAKYSRNSGFKAGEPLSVR